MMSNQSMISKEQQECSDLYSKKYNQSAFCDPIWDGVLCWPPTPVNSSTNVTCSEVFTKTNLTFNKILSDDSHAYRVCNQYAQWANGTFTDYNLCNGLLKETSVSIFSIIYTTIAASSVSMCLLSISLFIFYILKSRLKDACSRIRVHKNLFSALLAHSSILMLFSIFLISGFQYDIFCKIILSLQMYFRLAYIMWMFVEGLLLKIKVTKIFNDNIPFLQFCIIGWGLPVLITSLWIYFTNLELKTICWIGYGELYTVWIVSGPIFAALFANLYNLTYIIIRLKRMRTSENNTNLKAARRALILIPLFGIPNLVFPFNWRDNQLWQIIYMIGNCLIQATQGIVVSYMYCFIDEDIKTATLETIRRVSQRRNNSL